MKISLTLVLIFLFCTIAYANNVHVSDPVVTDPLQDEAKIGIRVTWENSWKCEAGHAPHNWDAVWVFVKFKRSDKDDWEHATLKGTTPGTLSENTLPTAAADKKGVMMYRKDAGYGDFSDTITLIWDRIVDIDMASRPTVSAEICVYAIEMVYVPQGAFYMGDGSNGTSYGTYMQGGSNPIQPYKVQSEAAVQTGSHSSYYTAAYPLYYKSPNGDAFHSIISAVTIQAAFPKGFAAFYCMKTEISQGQYCAFLNKLNSMMVSTDNIEKLYSPVSLEFEDEVTLAKYGNTITKNSYGIYEVADPYRACNFLTSRKVLAYLSWAALRPMSEMEYEKACRGTVTPRPSEYAWGRPSPTNKIAKAFKNSDEYETYTFNSAVDSANYHLKGIPRPTEGAVASPGRVGAFAQASTNRIQAGATYYGILDMSGGLAELVVPANRINNAHTFNRDNHGDGMPLVTFIGGVRNIPTWPVIPTAGGHLTGYGRRGGSFMNGPVQGGTYVHYYDPSPGQVSATDMVGGNGSGSVNTPYYGNALDYSYGQYPTKAIGQLGFYIHGYGGRGVRSF